MTDTAEESTSLPNVKKKKKKREFNANLAIEDADYKVRYVDFVAVNIKTISGCFHN